MGGIGAARHARAAVAAKGCNVVATFPLATPGVLTLYRWQPIGSPRVRTCEPGGFEINSLASTSALQREIPKYQRLIRPRRWVMSQAQFIANARTLLIALIVAGPLTLLGCSREEVTASGAASSQPETASVAAAVQNSAPASVCPNGGITVQSGIDTSGTGILGPSEVQNTQYLCNDTGGSNAVVAMNALVSVTKNEPAGSNCSYGGNRVNVGFDRNNNEVLEASEVMSMKYVCDGQDGGNGPKGLSTLIKVVTEPAGTNCPAGGVKITTGVDSNGNGAFDKKEITSTNYVCNGKNGSNGVNGLNSLMSTVAEPAGSHCASGGLKITSGLDANGNGALDPLEVTSTNYICNGANGTNGTNGANGLNSLTSMVAELSGTNCPSGGLKITSGLDANANGVLDTQEINSTNYICNGANGSNGTNGLNGLNSRTSMATEPPGPNCPSGGVKITSGLDTNGNGVLDPEEVTATNYACNGASGTNGTNGLNSLTSMATEGSGLNCPTGGLRINSGVDANANGVLDPSEVTSTNYICNGANGLTTSTGLNSLIAIVTEPPGSNCSYGGLRISVGLDLNGNGVLEQSEVASTAYSCSTDIAPAIESISIYPQPVITSANLLASLFDQDGDNLTSTWTIGGTSTITGSSAIWNSPGIPGLYLVNLAVCDGTYTVNGTSAINVGSASPWPRFHRDLQSTALSTVDTSATTGTLKWSYTTGGGVVSSPALAPDGTVYVGSMDTKLYAIHPDGTLKWSYTTGGGVTSSPAIAADGTVYVGSYDNKLYAIHPDGTLNWSYTTGSYVTSSPAIAADGTVYVGSWDQKLYAITPNGALKWSSTPMNSVLSSPAIRADGTVYIASIGSLVYAIHPDGTLIWSYVLTPADKVSSSPAIGADGTVYIGSFKSLYALSPNLTLKWTYTTGGAVTSSPAIAADGTVYVGSGDSKLYAIHPDGTLKWSYTTGGYIGGSSPAIGADGTVYIGSGDNYLYAINPDGTLKWRQLTGSVVPSSPAIGADGTVYVGSNDGKLYAIK